MLSFFKVERNAALLLLSAALLGLIAANSPFAAFARSIADVQLNVFGIGSGTGSGSGTGTDLRWLVSEFLMTGFFMLIGLELKRELTSGVFKDRRALAVPTLAALFGALVPAAVFVFVVGFGNPATAGWPIPMATDVTFALAIFAVFAKSMPKSSRSFLLSFAVIDDVIAILVIALFLGRGLNFAYLVAAVFTVSVFFYVSRLTTTRLTASLAVALAVASWFFTENAGISPVVVGVALGLCVPPSKVEWLEKRIYTWVSIGVLPLFAFFATQVSLAGGLALSATLSVAILLRPLGKIAGINLGALVARGLVKNSGFDDLRSTDILRISTLGGIGFTVALLVSDSVFGSGSMMGNQAVIATLLAMAASMVLGATALATSKN